MLTKLLHDIVLAVVTSVVCFAMRQRNVAYLVVLLAAFLAFETLIIVTISIADSIKVFVESLKPSWLGGK
ncbi:hypothetical protein BHU72_14845 [Desulfuribacillus stibiiarsenatis]|uniref:Uncharacterized protein n=1 Tax=Desulfuribacillus stibiiarsenatis TaxID=1390249 RepID=A0A1E5L7K7_9FIRM|nr:hypothetical protein [Desulfuribacillus stibiiarsenatis]OEH86028.1 hypothetical protein BHU72_14845 [Desulfuribacillus stibiiarsenatis]